MLLFYITDCAQFPGDENARQRALLAKIAEATRCGIDFIQLREKDLSTRELEALAHTAVRIIRENSLSGTEKREPATRVLINSRTDVAAACGADGVHLRADDISPSEVRKIWTQPTPPAQPLVSVSCHSAADVERAASERADFAVFAPVFEKKDVPGASPAGLDGLREACRQRIPVLALGGITLKNARACLDAGAAGIAAIRLFQLNDVAEVVRRLRG
ncbi:MAG TPA: thiamine phosphate synthase [Terriglobales bacterium]|nr:thiamine phosphate synthase [Terriglobales bacterium]